MTEQIFKKSLACPKCHTALRKHLQKGNCPKCKFTFTKKDGIWHFLYLPNKQTKTSKEKYETVHSHKFTGPFDGSYEILATFARGNKTVDIACGQGAIEKLAPETVGVEFSQNALNYAQKNGARHLVLANAHYLPFKDNSFDISISAGNLEHFENPQEAISEMARISKIQIMTVHRQLSIPFGNLFFHLLTLLFKIQHQPIENPIDTKSLKNMLEKAGLHIVFRGVWTLPMNYGRVIRLLPELKNLPSCSFVISIKK